MSLPLPFFHHRSCYILTLLIVLVTLLSAANPWKELLIPNQNGSSDLKVCIMPFVMHSAPLPVQQRGLYWKYCCFPLLLLTMKFSVQIQTFYRRFMILAFSGNSILVLSIYQGNSFDQLTCTALVVGWMGFPQLEPLPRLAANFKVSKSSCLL